MIRTVGFILLQIFTICAMLYVIVSIQPNHGVIRYDCTWSEISPDIPPKIKEECRKLNARKITYTRREGKNRNG